VTSPGFAARLIAVMLAVLTGYAVFVGLAFRSEATEREAEALQRVSSDLARHIVGRWPQVSTGDPAAAEQAARKALIEMLMGVNPGVQVYVLDADGKVADYLGEPGMVRTQRVELEPVRQFLAGARLPLRGTDPMGSGQGRLFSAAMFPPRPGQGNAQGTGQGTEQGQGLEQGLGPNKPPGYLYIVLDGAARQQAAQTVSSSLAWRSAGAAAALGLLIAAGLGAFIFLRMTRPLLRLAERMSAYSRLQAGPREPSADGGEVAVLEQAFERMTQRIEEQSGRERAQMASHRETMAGLAHDLRTPLTALHGHLEALWQGGEQALARQSQLLQAALTQSDKVRQLSQQLFELAALQSVDEVPVRERFRLDELVADSVGKFRLMAVTGDAGSPSTVPDVQLAAESPGALEVDGDLRLVERALTNLIDNARSHGRGPGPVMVSLSVREGHAQLVVEDQGPGLPQELHQRLVRGQSVREPPMRRATGGLGGLGLAIAQRVAVLHGGSLRPLPAPSGGTRLCMDLPLAS